MVKSSVCPRSVGGEFYAYKRVAHRDFAVAVADSAQERPKSVPRRPELAKMNPELERTRWGPARTRLKSA